MTTTTFIENGEEVFPCRCGETHRGPYAAYDFGHHDCFHNEPLLRIGDDDEMPLLCPSCGKTFAVERREA